MRGQALLLVFRGGVCGGVGPVSLQLGKVCFGRDHALCMRLWGLALEAKMSKLPWLGPGASGQACGPLCRLVWLFEVLECPVWLE